MRMTHLECVDKNCEKSAFMLDKLSGHYAVFKSDATVDHSVVRTLCHGEIKTNCLFPPGGALPMSGSTLC